MSYTYIKLTMETNPLQKNKNTKIRPLKKG